MSPPPVQQILGQRVRVWREPVSREIARLLRDGLLARGRGGLVIRRAAEWEGAVVAPLPT